uniref:Ccr_10 putative toxin n=1 Tax=Crassispira cerithina TaxID=1077925 RepID=A0A098LXW8_CRACE
MTPRRILTSSVPPTLMMTLIILTSARAVTSVTCDDHPAANGCSNPLPELQHEEKFFSACNRHDVCYGCGSLYNITRLMCDNFFMVDMVMACISTRRVPSISCLSMATKFFAAVRIFGYFFYINGLGERSYCVTEQDPPCLPETDRK